MDMIKTGDFLRSLRKAKGLTQEDVATRLMLSPKTISRWESGLGLPDISIITDVATLYDVTVDEILKGQRNSKNLKEETEKSNDKKVNNILTNKITSKFNIYFYVKCLFSNGGYSWSSFKFNCCYCINGSWFYNFYKLNYIWKY